MYWEQYEVLLLTQGENRTLE